MLISRALRMERRETVALVGGGGKTTLMFRLAAELAGSGARVVTTMTTRIFIGQMALAPAHLIWQDETSLTGPLHELLDRFGHVLLAGSVSVEQDKVSGLPAAQVDRIAADPGVDCVIVEADGSRRLPFKAPADHEPVIPSDTTIVIPVVGMDVLGRPLTAENVHRPHLVAALAGADQGDPVTPELIAAVLAHPSGGAKGAPPGARLVPFLNKVEGETVLAEARATARMLLAHPRVDCVVIGSAAGTDPVREVWSRVGAVVLAAGGATRFARPARGTRAGVAHGPGGHTGRGGTRARGALKQVMPWEGKPLVAHVADQALGCPDVGRVVVAVGAGADDVRRALGERDVLAVHVSDWAGGQSRSVRAGLNTLLEQEHGSLGAALFLLADQPGITPALLSELVQRHRETLAPVVAPRYQGQRGNPGLFDRATFPDFATLQGDIGARPILQTHHREVAWVDWPTPEVLQDIDTVDDYRPPAKS
jgi:molybdenum cofactor cytidylyltransferase